MMFISDHPEYFWYLGRLTYSYNSKGVSTVNLIYELNGIVVTDAEEAEEELEDIVEEIIDGIPKGANEYDTALYLHDVLTKRVTYVPGINNQTAYGALVDGEALCAGYARAYQLLMQEAGLDAWTVRGYSYVPKTNPPQPIGHAWNLVWIKDKCFYVDATWDDQEKETFHEYFVCTLEDFKDSHFPDPEFENLLPKCEHEKEDFFDKEMGIISGICGNITGSTNGKDLIDYMDITRQGGYFCGKLTFHFDGSDNQMLSWLDKNEESIGKALGLLGWKFEYGIIGHEVHVTFSCGTPSTYTETTETVELQLNYTDSGLKKGKAYDLWVAYYSEDGQFLGYKCEKMTLDKNMNATVSAETMDGFADCRVMVLDDPTAAPICYAMQLYKE